MISPEQDAWGQLLKVYLDTGDAFEVIERDDGYLALGSGPDVYFFPYDDWPQYYKDAMTQVRGRVLDIGAGAGRHSLYLQQQGHQVIAIDNSPLAVEVCKARGVVDARVLPIASVDEQVGIIDTIVMLGNNFGLFADAQQTRALLERFWSLTSAQGRIIAESRNPYETRNPVHLAYHEHNRQQGRMGGQVRMRVRYLQYTGPWFDYLLVSPAEMGDLVAGTGWSIAQLVGDSNDMYIAVLEKVQP